jgi:hypothetical protein
MSLRASMLGLLGAAVVGAGADAAELASVALKDDVTIVVLSGDIAQGDAEAAEALIRTVNEDGRLISAVRLDSSGGSLAEAVRLADLIRRAKLPTVVAAGSHCVSACFLVFAAGTEKFAHHTARIGVHGASDGLGRETARTEAATLAMGRIASTFGVPADIIRRMVMTPARDIAWLSNEDLRAMGTIITGRTERPTAPTPADDPQLVTDDLLSSAAPPHPAAP